MVKNQKSHVKNRLISWKSLESLIPDMDEIKVMRKYERLSTKPFRRSLFVTLTTYRPIAIAIINSSRFSFNIYSLYMV